MLNTSSKTSFLIEFDVPERPHQPKQFQFPKCSFGQKTTVYRSEWFLKWPFLHYDESCDTVFCHTFLLACKHNWMKTKNIDPAFVSCCLHGYLKVQQLNLMYRCNVGFTIGRVAPSDFENMKNAAVTKRQLELWLFYQLQPQV